jgi:hypothetical protein
VIGSAVILISAVRPIVPPGIVSCYLQQSSWHAPVGVNADAPQQPSPWYSNMTTLFSKKHLVDLRFTARQLARDKGARRTHVPGAVAP